jgi:SOS-response transcriptional repressor LexA
MRIKTDRSMDVFNWIVEFKRNHDGLSPTVREIQRGMKYRTTSAVHYHLVELEKRGMIQIYRNLDGASSRGIIIPGGQWTYAGAQG